MMFCLREPAAEQVLRFLSEQRSQALSYGWPGMTRGAPPAGYNADCLRWPLGRGPDAFTRACEALRGWRMFRQSWVRLHGSDTPPQTGAVVAVAARIAGVWWLNACRVVYVFEEAGPVRRVGFAYGTLPGHAEEGEERFSVELAADDSVWYEVLAYSRPRHWLARLGYPLSRMVQRRFARGSAVAMEVALNSARAGSSG